MKLIERYLFSLGNYLSKENKDEILKEVEANIYDMIGDDYSDENVIRVLKELGHPRKLSTEYQTKKRYLIGPEYFDSYIKILPLLVILVGSIFFVITFFSAIVRNMLGEEEISNYFKLLGLGIEAFFDGAIASAIWLTIVFVIIEHVDYTFDGKKVIKKSEWSPEMLKDLPKPKTIKFKKSHLISEIIVNTIFTILFITFSQHIGIYNETGLVASLFVQERFAIYAYAFIFMLIYLIIQNLVMLFYKYPNYKVAGIKTIYTILNAVIALFFIFDKKLFNPQFSTEFMNITNMTLSQYESISIGLRTFIAVIITITSIIEIIKIFISSYKNSNQYYKK